MGEIFVTKDGKNIINKDRKIEGSAEEAHIVATGHTSTPHRFEPEKTARRQSRPPPWPHFSPLMRTLGTRFVLILFTIVWTERVLPSKLWANSGEVSAQ